MQQQLLTHPESEIVPGRLQIKQGHELQNMAAGQYQQLNLHRVHR